MSDIVWRDIALAAIGLLQAVLVASIAYYDKHLNKRLDKQDELLKEVVAISHHNTNTLTEHAVEIRHLKDNNHIVRYPERV